MNIGIDLDNTLIRNKILAHELVAIKYPNHYIPELKDYEYSNFPYFIKNKIYELYNNSWYMGKCMNYILPNRISYMKKWIDSKNKIFIITARNNIIRNITEDLIMNFFPLLNIRAYFVQHNTSKKYMFRNLNIDIWIDDSPIGISEAYNERIPSFLIRDDVTIKYNWQIKEKKSLINIVKDFKEIDNILTLL